MKRYVPEVDSAILNLDGIETETNRSAKIICDESFSLCDDDCDDLKRNMRRRMRRRKTMRTFMIVSKLYRLRFEDFLEFRIFLCLVREKRER